HDDEFLTIDLDLAARPLAEQDPVAGLDVEGMQLAVLPAGPRPDRDHFALHGLFLGGVGYNNAAGRLFILLDAADQDTVLQWPELHIKTPPLGLLGRLSARAAVGTLTDRVLGQIRVCAISVKDRDANLAAVAGLGS